MEVCRETMIMSPLAVDFETLCIQDDDHNTNTSPNIALFALPEKQRSLSWENRRSTSSSTLDDSNSLPGNPATPTSQQPLFKVGSGEFNVRKTKKSRPSLLGEKHAELVVEQLITKQFVEEEAELATLSLDFANKVAAQKDEEVSPRCPAPDPSSMMMLSRPKKALQDKKHRRASLDVTTYPFGLRPRMKRKRGFMAPNMLSPDDSEESDSELSPPSSPPSSTTATTTTITTTHHTKRGIPILKKSLSTDTGIDIPTLDFAKLRALRDRSLLSPHPSPLPSPHQNPSSPTPLKPDCAKYRSIESSPRSAFVKPNSA